MTMSELLSRLGTGQARADTEVCYLQSQNGNLYTFKYFEAQEDSSELEPIREDVPSEMAWSSEALGWRTPAYAPRILFAIYRQTS